MMESWPSSFLCKVRVQICKGGHPMACRGCAYIPRLLRSADSNVFAVWQLWLSVLSVALQFRSLTDRQWPPVYTFRFPIPLKNPNLRKEDKLPLSNIQSLHRWLRSSSLEILKTRRIWLLLLLISDHILFPEFLLALKPFLTAFDT